MASNIDRMEPGVFAAMNVDPKNVAPEAQMAAAQTSIAISLKRIADALQPQQFGFRVGESLAAIAETLQEKRS